MTYFSADTVRDVGLHAGAHLHRLSNRDGQEGWIRTNARHCAMPPAHA